MHQQEHSIQAYIEAAKTNIQRALVADTITISVLVAYFSLAILAVYTAETDAANRAKIYAAIPTISGLFLLFLAYVRYRAVGYIFVAAEIDVALYPLIGRSPDFALREMKASTFAPPSFLFYGFMTLALLALSSWSVIEGLEAFEGAIPRALFVVVSCVPILAAVASVCWFLDYYNKWKQQILFAASQLEASA